MLLKIHLLVRWMGVLFYELVHEIMDEYYLMLR